MYNVHIQTPLDSEFETCKEAIQVKHDKENPCWFNTRTDWYKDTLMGELRRGKNRLTNESRLKLMTKTEDDFQTNGASIQDMVPVFEHYGIHSFLRVYWVFYRVGHAMGLSMLFSMGLCVVP